MKIQTIPDEWNDVLYTWQEAEIRKRITEPIAWVGWGDPAWTELDKLLTGSNLHSDLSDTGVECTLHEISPARFAVWIQDTATQHSGEEVILINASDLEKFREQGIWGLNADTLFGDWRADESFTSFISESNRSSTPVIDRLVSDPKYGYSSHDAVVQLFNRRLGTTDWVEMTKTPEVNRMLSKFGAIYNLYKSDYYLKGYTVDWGQPLLWIDCPDENTVWIRQDLVDEHLPDWGIQSLLDEW